MCLPQQNLCMMTHLILRSLRTAMVKANRKKKRKKKILRLPLRRLLRVYCQHLLASAHAVFLLLAVTRPMAWISSELAHIWLHPVNGIVCFMIAHILDHPDHCLDCLLLPQLLDHPAHCLERLSLAHVLDCPAHGWVFCWLLKYCTI